MTFQNTPLLVRFAVLALTPAFGFAADAPATQPISPSAAAQPAAVSIDPAVQALVDQLADPSPATRENANKKLQDMGKLILPQLEALAGTDDPEARARVQELLRRLHRRMPPVAPKSSGAFSSHSRSTSIGADGARTIDVSENGRKIHIEDRNGKSIRMTVSGVDENGREATEKYEAKDADELKQDNPEAYALYEELGGTTPGTSSIKLRINGGGVLVLPPGNAVPGRRGLPNIKAEPPAKEQPPEKKEQPPAKEEPAKRDAPADALGDVREMIRREIQAGNLPADMQQKLLDQLDDMQKRHAELLDRMKQLQEMDKTEKSPVPDARPQPPGRPAPRKAPPKPEDDDPIEKV